MVVEFPGINGKGMIDWRNFLNHTREIHDHYDIAGAL